MQRNFTHTTNRPGTEHQEKATKASTQTDTSQSGTISDIMGFDRELLLDRERKADAMPKPQQSLVGLVARGTDVNVRGKGADFVNHKHARTVAGVASSAREINASNVNLWGKDADFMKSVVESGYTVPWSAYENATGKDKEMFEYLILSNDAEPMQRDRLFKELVLENFYRSSNVLAGAERNQRDREQQEKKDELERQEKSKRRKPEDFPDKKTSSDKKRKPYNIFDPNNDPEIDYTPVLLNNVWSKQNVWSEQREWRSFILPLKEQEKLLMKYENLTEDVFKLSSYALKAYEKNKFTPPKQFIPSSASLFENQLVNFTYNMFLGYIEDIASGQCSAKELTIWPAPWSDFFKEKKTLTLFGLGPLIRSYNFGHVRGVTIKFEMTPECKESVEMLEKFLTAFSELVDPAIVTVELNSRSFKPNKTFAESKAEWSDSDDEKKQTPPPRQFKAAKTSQWKPNPVQYDLTKVENYLKTVKATLSIEIIQKTLQQFETINAVINAHVNTSTAELLQQLKESLNKKPLSEKSQLSTLTLLSLVMLKKTGLQPYFSQLYTLMCILKQGIQAFNQFVQVSTGEGKSIIIALLAAYQGLQGKMVTIATPTKELAQLGAEKFHPFYQALNLSSTYVGPDEAEHSPAKLADKFNQAILYADIADLEHMSLFADIGDKIKQRHEGILIVDEIDLFAVHSKSPAIINVEYDNPLPQAVYAYFYKQAEQYKFDPHLCRNIYHNMQEEFTEFKDNLPSHDEITAWLLSAKKISTLKENVDFIRKSDSAKKSRVILIDTLASNQLRQQDELQYPGNRFIYARFESPYEKGKIAIARITHTQFLQKHSQVYGLSGTVKPELAELEKTYQAKCLIIPRREQSKLEVLPSKIASDVFSKYKLIAEQANQLCKQGRSNLIFCKSIEDVYQLYTSLSQSCKTAKIQYYTGQENERSVEDIIKQAGQPGVITITTGIFTRGIDIQPEQSVVKRGGLFVTNTTFDIEHANEMQKFARAGRNTQPGQAQNIWCKEDLPGRLRYKLKNSADNSQVILDKEAIENFRIERKRLLAKRNELKTLVLDVTYRCQTFLFNNLDASLDDEKKLEDNNLDAHQVRLRWAEFMREFDLDIHRESLYLLMNYRVLNDEALYCELDKMIGHKIYFILKRFEKLLLEHFPNNKLITTNFKRQFKTELARLSPRKGFKPLPTNMELITFSEMQRNETLSKDYQSFLYNMRTKRLLENWGAPKDTAHKWMLIMYDITEYIWENWYARWPLMKCLYHWYADYYCKKYTGSGPASKLAFATIRQELYGFKGHHCEACVSKFFNREPQVVLRDIGRLLNITSVIIDYGQDKMERLQKIAYLAFIKRVLIKYDYEELNNFLVLPNTSIEDKVFAILKIGIALSHQERNELAFILKLDTSVHKSKQMSKTKPLSRHQLFARGRHNKTLERINVLLHKGKTTEARKLHLLYETNRRLGASGRTARRALPPFDEMLKQSLVEFFDKKPIVPQP